MKFHCTCTISYKFSHHITDYFPEVQIFPNGLTVTTWENLFWNVVRSLIVGCRYDIGGNWLEQNISLKMTCRSMQGSIKQQNTFTTMAAANPVS